MSWVSLTMNSVQFFKNNHFRLKRNSSWGKKHNFRKSPSQAGRTVTNECPLWALQVSEAVRGAEPSAGGCSLEGCRLLTWGACCRGGVGHETGLWLFWRTSWHISCSCFPDQPPNRSLFHTFHTFFTVAHWWLCRAQQWPPACDSHYVPLVSFALSRQVVLEQGGLDSTRPEVVGPQLWWARLISVGLSFRWAFVCGHSKCGHPKALCPQRTCCLSVKTVVNADVEHV